MGTIVPEPGRQAREIPPDPTNLEAGPEFDALVAEKVMGWERRPRWPARTVRDWKLTDFGLVQYDRLVPAGGGDAWFGPGGERPVAEITEQENCCDCGDYEEPWSPSTDIAAAWQVVEKLKLSVVLTENERDWLAGPYSGYINDDGVIDGFVYPFAFAASAPLAICRAALRAVSSM